MSKQQTAETLSPLSLVTGAIAYASAAQRVEALQNYVSGRRPRMHLSLGPSSLGGATSPPVSLTWPSSGTTTMLTGEVYLVADFATVTIGLEANIASAGTTLRATVTVGGATAVNIDATSANNGAEQTTTVSIASAGTGWRTVTVALTRVSGASAGEVRYLSIQDTPITSSGSLANPAND